MSTFETERALLKSLNHSIDTSKDSASEYRDLRVQVMRTLERNGVDRKTIAEWSGVTAMVVSRALGPKSNESG